MIRVFFLIFCLSCSIVFDSISQDSTQVRIGLGSGVALGAVKNELISYYRHQGSAAPVQLTALINTRHKRQDIRLFYSSLRMRSASGSIGTRELRGYLQHSAHWRIRTRKDNFNFFGGFLLNANASFRRNSQNGVVLGNNNGGEMIASLGPSVLAEKNFDRYFTSIQCWLPLIGWSIQPGYALSTQESNLLTPSVFREIGARASCSTNIGRRVDARLDYQFGVYRLSTNETVISLSHQFIFSLTYQFGKL